MGNKKHKSRAYANHRLGVAAARTVELINNGWSAREVAQTLSAWFSDVSIGEGYRWEHNTACILYYVGSTYMAQRDPTNDPVASIQWLGQSVRAYCDALLADRPDAYDAAMRLHRLRVQRDLAQRRRTQTLSDSGSHVVDGTGAVG